MKNKEQNISFVAVFGTLKYGQSANSMMGDTPDSFIVGETIQTYSMSDVGFPYIRRDTSGDPVLVHVYAVSDAALANLDRFEGVPHHYTREVCDVWIGGSEETLENVFIYEAAVTGGVDVSPIEGILCWNNSLKESEKDVLTYLSGMKVDSSQIPEMCLEYYLEEVIEEVPPVYQKIGAFPEFSKKERKVMPFTERVLQCIREENPYGY